MYNSLLDTFIAVTDCGSFTKAAERLYISSTASAKAVHLSADTTFCVGTSLLNPAKPFMDLWYRVNKGFPDYKLHLVPFEDDHNGILSEIERLGEKFDFLTGVCDSKIWMSRCSFLQLGSYKKMIAVSREHRLAGEKKVRGFIRRNADDGGAGRFGRQRFPPQ